MKRLYEITTTTTVEVVTTGKWSDDQVIEALRVGPSVTSGLFSYDGTRNGSVRVVDASLTELRVKRGRS